MTGIEIIRAEIERLLNKEWKWQSSTEGKFRCETYREILDFIDSLPEDVSEDLEEAAMAYLKDATKRAMKTGVGTGIVATFEAGAQWQKKKMLKDAIEREVHEDGGGYPYIDATEFYDYDKDIPLAKKGDKIKVIMVKED